MLASVLLYSVLAFALLEGIPTFASQHDVVNHPHHRHAEGHHQHHSRHGHKGLSARDSNSTAGNGTATNGTASSGAANSTADSNSTFCLSSSEIELATIVKLLNKSEDLQFFFELIPPSLKVSSGTSNSTNTTILNGTISIDLASYYHESSKYRVIEFFARVFGALFANPKFAATEFGINIINIVLNAFAEGSNSTSNTGNNNSWSNGNFSNLTKLENWLTPSKFISNVEHVQHAIGTGISNAVHNVSSILGFKKHE